MLQVNPALSQEQLERVLQQTVRTETSMGTLPNDTWGAGKVDGLTDLEYTVVFRNVATGQSVTHFKPEGSTDGGNDTTGLSWSPVPTRPVETSRSAPR